MVTKKIQRMTGKTAVITVPQQHRMPVYGSIGKQAAAFAKRILDKYAKILNYQFDYDSLVFLERAAGEWEKGQPEQQMVLLSVKLLAFLAQNTNSTDLFFRAGTVFSKQLAGQIERSLEFLKETGAESGKELSRCYLEYQRLSQTSQTTSGNGNGVISKQYVLLEQQLVQLAKKQEQKMRHSYQPASGQMEQPAEGGVCMVPVLMTHSFFANLNHCLRENQMPDYRRRWHSANWNQMRQYVFRERMQQFLAEPDFLKQEMQLADMLRQFGKKTLSAYLEHADSGVFEKILPAMQALSGIRREPAAAKIPGMQKTDAAQLEMTDDTLEMVFAQKKTPEAGKDEKEQLLAFYLEAEAEIARLLSGETAAAAGGSLENSEIKRVPGGMQMAESEEKIAGVQTVPEYRRAGTGKAESLEEKTAGVQMLPEHRRAGTGKAESEEKTADVHKPQEEKNAVQTGDSEIFTQEQIQLLRDVIKEGKEPGFEKTGVKKAFMRKTNLKTKK